MARAKKTKEKKETYYQRWLKGKKRMLLIMKEEEFNAVKQFCDAHQMSYREFFTTVAPKLLIEKQQLAGEIEGLRKALADKEAQVNDITAKYNALAEKYNTLLQKYKEVKAELESVNEKYSELLSENASLRDELKKTANELSSTRGKLTSVEAQLKAKEEELSKLREAVEIIVKHGRAEVPTEFCEKLKPFGFGLAQKEVSTGFMKKSVVSICTNV